MTTLTTDLKGLAKRLREAGFLVQDLAAVASGLKPMCRWGLTQGDAASWKLLEEFCAASGLVARKYDGPGGREVAVGKKAATLEEFDRLARNVPGDRPSPGRGRDVRRMGELLGYPTCCVEAFAASEAAPPASFPRAVFERSASGAAAPLPFALNFLFSFHSRSNGPAGKLQSLLSGGYRGMDLFLVPWIPCSFSCAPSRAYGEKVLKEVAALDLEVSGRLERSLANVVVFVDDWSFVPLLKAVPERGGWRYEEAYDAKTLIPAAAYKLLKAGDFVQAGPEGIEVWKGKKSLGVLPRETLLFGFGA